MNTTSKDRANHVNVKRSFQFLPKQLRTPKAPKDEDYGLIQALYHRFEHHFASSDFMMFPKLKFRVSEFRTCLDMAAQIFAN